MNVYIEQPTDIIHETSVDFVTRPCGKLVHVVQYDNSLPIVKVRINVNGQPYVLPQADEAVIRFGKLDGTFVIKNVLGCSEDRTYLYFSVDEQMTVMYGHYGPVIELMYDEYYTASSPIHFVVDRNPVQSYDIESQVVYPSEEALWSAVNGCNGHVSDLTVLVNSLSSDFSDLSTLVGGYETRISTLESAESNRNVQNGIAGYSSIQQKKMDGDVDSFTTDNLVARQYDSSLNNPIDVGASGDRSAAFGKQTAALKTNAFVIGNKCIADGEESMAQGYKCVSIGDGSHAQGANTVSYGLQSHSEGAYTLSYGPNSHAEGHYTISGANASHSEGVDTKVGNYSQESGIGADQTPGGGGGGDTPPSPGYVAEAGEGSHGEGYRNIIRGWGSHGEGLRNFLSGNYAHIAGVNNTNSADYANVEGYNNINTGNCSLVAGTWNNNTRYSATVLGTHNKNTTNDYKLVAGRYNADISNAIFEIGIGVSDSNRSNAITAYFNGEVDIGTQGSRPLSVATFGYVNTRESAIKDYSDIKDDQLKTYVDNTMQPILYRHDIVLTDATDSQHPNTLHFSFVTTYGEMITTLAKLEYLQHNFIRSSAYLLYNGGLKSYVVILGGFVDHTSIHYVKENNGTEWATFNISSFVDNGFLPIL